MHKIMFLRWTIEQLKHCLCANRLKETVNETVKEAILKNVNKFATSLHEMHS